MKRERKQMERDGNNGHSATSRLLIFCLSVDLIVDLITFSVFVYQGLCHIQNFSFMRTPGLSWGGAVDSLTSPILG